MEVDWGFVVAALALVATIWSECRQRRHDRLSIRPALKIGGHAPDANKPATVTIENHGEGAAIFDSVVVIIGDKRLDARDAETILNELTAQDFPKNRLAVTSIEPGEWLKAGADTPLIRVEQGEVTPEFVYSWSRLRVEIRYQSVYKEKFFREWAVIAAMSPTSQAKAKLIDALPIR